RDDTRYRNAYGENEEHPQTGITQQPERREAERLQDRMFMPAHNDGLQLKARAAGRDQQEQQVREKLNSGHECGLFMEGCLKVVALGQSQAKGPRPGCLTIICET